MSILSGFEKQKRYITDDNGDKKLVSEWTSTDTVELSDGVENAETTRAEAEDWLDAYDNTDTQPNGLTDLVSKLTTYMSNVKYLKNELDKLSAIDHHPIGSLYWSSSATNPSELFGGEWTRIKDRFIWAAGDNDVIGSIGGASSYSFTPTGSISNESITLQTKHLPSHSHSLNNHTHSIPKLSGTAQSAGAHTHKADYPSWVFAAEGDGARMEVHQEGGYSKTGDTTSNGAHTHTVETNANTTGQASGNTGNTGSGTPFSHGHTFTGTGVTIPLIPPYKVYYCWERTA